jgi:hypothetical protein
MSSVISPTLRGFLEEGGASCTAIVTMARETQEVMDSLESREFPSRDAKVNAMTSELQALAEESQKSIKTFLDSQSSPPIKYKSMWITNTLVIYDASLPLLLQVESLGGIKEIREEATAHTMRSVVNINKGANKQQAK